MSHSETIRGDKNLRSRVISSDLDLERCFKSNTTVATVDKTLAIVVTDFSITLRSLETTE